MQKSPPFQQTTFAACDSLQQYLLRLHTYLSWKRKRVMEQNITFYKQSASIISTWMSSSTSFIWAIHVGHLLLDAKLCKHICKVATGFSDWRRKH
ncbi:hypothetical protein PoB_007187200 [Plakobranchus ocellatus]|uniref:Uncharacterized protein n=1 Tax=Plakobranchus ocellatus TaxID=259542 RepID=A0AAV4DMM7_9GAST|nr:hypothetical protein PoB_007187200 [Plakobranchus ocellatus]